MTPRTFPWWVLLGVVLLALFPAIAEQFYLQLVTKIMILSIFALSLDLLVGYTGLVSLGRDIHFYYLVLALLAMICALLWMILRSPFGRALQGIKANEQRMRALGFPTLRYKLAAFVLAGTVAGLAGYLAAAKEGYVNPELMAWHQSGVVLMMLILGGMGTLFGAVIGTFSYG